MSSGKAYSKTLHPYPHSLYNNNKENLPMFNIRTVALAATFILSIGPAIADPSSTAVTSQTAGQACPTGEYDANYPGVPAQCVKCAAPGCPSCHSERTKETVADTTAAERNCPPVKPH